jgi:hypothetical protein
LKLKNNLQRRQGPSLGENGGQTAVTSEAMRITFEEREREKRKREKRKKNGSHRLTLLTSRANAYGVT